MLNPLWSGNKNIPFFFFFFPFLEPYSLMDELNIRKVEESRNARTVA